MRKLSRNSAGFGAIEGLLIVVIVALVGFVGWYVWHSKNNTDNSYSAAGSVNNNSTAAKQTTETKPSVDETANWLIYEPPGKEYKIRLADGWELTKTPSSSNLIAFGGIDYKPGTKATVRELEGGRGGPLSFALFVNNQDTFVCNRGDKQVDFKTNGGLTGSKYLFVQTENRGENIAKGDKEYTYRFQDGSNKICILHDAYQNQSSKIETVEKVVKSLEIN